MNGESARRRAVGLTGCALFSLLAAFGREAERLMADDPLAQSDLPRALAAWLALFALSAAALHFWRARPARAPRAPKPSGRPFRPKRAFCLLLLCYAPMYAAAFPGSFAYDVPFQLKQVFTHAYSSHHPLLHTLLLGGCIRLGQALGSVTAGAALYTALQCALLAACFSLTCASVARRSGARAARFSAIFFALYPLHAVFAVNATKDTLFSGLFALTLAYAAEAIIDGLTLRTGARFCACASLTLLLRNNAVYAAAVWLLLLPPLLGRRGLRLTLAAALSLAAALAAGALLSLALTAQRGDPCEMLSWPIQQLARARVTQGERLSEEEREAIDELMPGEAWRLYDPAISDPVKFEFDSEALLSDPARYARVYLSVARKCPHAYFDALLLHTYPFFYPYGAYRVPGRYVQMTVGTDYYDGWWQGERIHSAFPRLLAALQWRFGNTAAANIPVLGLPFNTGAIVWATLFLALRALYEGRRGAFAVSLLPVLLWGTYLLGPVMAGRYVYPFVCAMPVLATKERS